MNDPWNDVREWVAYLGEMGVRELAVPEPRRPGAVRAPAAGQAAPERAKNAPRTAPAADKGAVGAPPQPALLAIEERGFAEPPPADPALRLAEIREELESIPIHRPGEPLTLLDPGALEWMRECLESSPWVRTVEDIRLWYPNLREPGTVERPGCPGNR